VSTTARWVTIVVAVIAIVAMLLLVRGVRQAQRDLDTPAASAVVLNVGPVAESTVARS
jgi:hypothetical protein